MYKNEKQNLTQFKISMRKKRKRKKSTTETSKTDEKKGTKQTTNQRNKKNPIHKDKKSERQEKRKTRESRPSTNRLHNLLTDRATIESSRQVIKQAGKQTRRRKPEKSRQTDTQGWAECSSNLIGCLATEGSLIWR